MKSAWTVVAAASVAGLSVWVAEHEKRKRSDERAGRTKAERKLRETAQTKMKESIGVSPIGFVHSVYRARKGTPRQGCLVPDSRSYIQMENHVQPKLALDQLDTFSHVWIIAVFHENTNLAKVQDQQCDVNRRGVKPQIRPPRLGNAKVGLYSTRSPHRHNPIALSTARIQRVDKEKGRVWLSGADLIEGTPVLDVKPYIPRYDAIEGSSAPSWIQEDDASRDFDTVVIPGPILDRIRHDIMSRKSIYAVDEAEEAIHAVYQNLRLDHRSHHQRKNKDTLFPIQFDIWILNCSIQGSSLFVQSCSYN